MNRKKDLLFALILVFIIIIGALFFLNRPISKLTTVEKMSKMLTSDYSGNEVLEQLVVRECAGNVVTNAEAGFSILCPEGLTMYIYPPKLNQYVRKMESRIFLCESDLDTDPSHGYNFCKSGGLMIWANGDGWGGGCDAKNHREITVDGKTYEACLFDDGVGQLYVGSRDVETASPRFLLESNFSDTFTQEQALGVIATFKML